MSSSQQERFTMMAARLAMEISCIDTIAGRVRAVSPRPVSPVSVVASSAMENRNKRYGPNKTPCVGGKKYHMWNGGMRCLRCPAVREVPS